MTEGQDFVACKTAGDKHLKIMEKSKKETVHT